MLLTSTTDLAPAALAASAMIRGPSTLTSRNDCGRFRRTATRLMMCSVPWAAWITAAGLSASPTMTWAPRTLKAAAFIGSRTSTRSWWPASRNLWATPRPTKPVEPRRRILATAENPIGAILTFRRGWGNLERICSGHLRLSARDRRHRRGPAEAPGPGEIPRDVRRVGRDHLHGGLHGLRGRAAARRSRADGPRPRLQALNRQKSRFAQNGPMEW